MPLVGASRLCLSSVPFFSASQFVPSVPRFSDVLWRVPSYCVRCIPRPGRTDLRGPPPALFGRHRDAPVRRYRATLLQSCYLVISYLTTLLLRHAVIVLLCYLASVLLYFFTVLNLLPCCRPSLLYCYLATQLPCYSATLLPCYLATLLLCHPVTCRRHCEPCTAYKFCSGNYRTPPRPQ